MSINILLADDSITIQKVIGIIFGGDDYSLSIVDNGMAVLDKARQTAPDILLIDALMPGMSGYEVCELVRATPGLSQKPILLLTGSFEPFDEEKAKNCGADDFIAKPFESQQIIAKVKELCELGASRAIPTLQVTADTTAEQTLPPAVQAFAAAPVGDSALDDIWGAFTTTAEIPPAQPSPLPEVVDTLESDVFSIVSEDPEGLFMHPEPPPLPRTAEPIASQWTPVDENFFEFGDQATAEIPSHAFSPSPSSLGEMSFGDISAESQQETEISTFLDIPPANAMANEDTVDTFSEIPFPVFEEPAASPPFPTESVRPSLENESISEAVANPVAATAPETTASTSLTEEQLKEVIAGLSKEVIERIVWEVVPDLAENLIREAIRTIREGQ